MFATGCLHEGKTPTGYTTNQEVKEGGGHLLKGGVLLRACGTPDTDKITIQLTSVGLAQAGSNYTIRVVW